GAFGGGGSPAFARGGLSRRGPAGRLHRRDHALHPRRLEALGRGFRASELTAFRFVVVTNGHNRVTSHEARVSNALPAHESGGTSRESGGTSCDRLFSCSGAACG